MARLFFTIATIFSLGQLLSKTYSQASASVVNRQAVASESHPTSTKPQNNGNRKTFGQQTCSKFPNNQITRKEYIALLSQHFSQHFRPAVYSTTKAPQLKKMSITVESDEKKSKTKRQKVEEKKKRIFFPNLVTRQRNSKGIVMKFVLGNDDIPSQMTSVKLWAYNLCERRVPKARLTIKLFNKKTKCGSRIHNLYQNKKPGIENCLKKSASNKGWLAFDITVPTKTAWSNARRMCQNVAKMELSLTIKSPKCISLVAHKTADDKKRRPYLELISPNDPIKLPKKNTVPLRCTPTEKRCCLQRTAVSFDELRISPDQIIAPRTFQGGYCRGLCSSNSQFGNQRQRESRPCCVPTKTYPISILDWKDGFVVLRNIPDALVRECGCI